MDVEINLVTHIQNIFFLMERMRQTSEYIESHRDKKCFMKLSGYIGGCWYLSVSTPDIKCLSFYGSGSQIFEKQQLRG